MTCPTPFYVEYGMRAIAPAGWDEDMCLFSWDGGDRDGRAGMGFRLAWLRLVHCCFLSVSIVLRILNGCCNA